jgi:hypothetical protein
MDWTTLNGFFLMNVFVVHKQKQKLFSDFWHIAVNKTHAVG